MVRLPGLGVGFSAVNFSPFMGKSSLIDVASDARDSTQKTRLAEEKSGASSTGTLQD